MVFHNLQIFEEQCLEAWDFVNHSWKGWGLAYPPDAYMRCLIRDLLDRGYDRKLYPHPYGYTMTLARTVDDQNMDQPRIIFVPRQNFGMEVALFGANLGLVLKIERAEITPEVENLLNLLIIYPIDYQSLDYWKGL